MPLHHNGAYFPKNVRQRGIQKDRECQIRFHPFRPRQHSNNGEILFNRRHEGHRVSGVKRSIGGIFGWIRKYYLIM